MKPSHFAYHRPRSVEEAVDLLAELGDEAKVLAGGQSLIPMMNLRLAQPETLVDIAGIRGLDRMTRSDGRLAVGAATRHQALASYPVSDGTLDALREAAGHIGHLPIRTRGTFGGSLAHADPTAEWCVLALALDAEVIAVSREGPRTVPVDGFFLGPFQTSLDDGELLVETRLRRAHGAALQEHAPRHGDFASVVVAAALDLDDGTMSHPRIALGGVAGTPVRSEGAERILAGAAPTAGCFREAAAAAAQGTDPPADAAATATHRRRLVKGLTEAALQRAVARASRQRQGGRA